jgi:hypothetical protein
MPDKLSPTQFQHGDDGRGKDGLIGCCKYICRENPGAFAGLLAKVLTAQVRLQHDKTLTVALEDLKLVAKEMKEVGLSPESPMARRARSRDRSCSAFATTGRMSRVNRTRASRRINTS